MLSQSKIEVWYKVAGDRILLGETFSSNKLDVISLWVDLHSDQRSSTSSGYRVSLFDDGGRHIADKGISALDAERLLEHNEPSDVYQVVNQLSFCVESYCSINNRRDLEANNGVDTSCRVEKINDGNDNQANLAFI
ncbi:hypothetical protein R3X26_00410 [Vibrio sp. TH_r3]|uniref:hypothetical protein n=1 Tax=Vibrio sp. TH_r3 TaxID=3082084 RepID=UPI00295495EC|nr:hypothetical protein [Vibrio sp. TH_r3]MDV7102863.1 hypothetical protein [Vibrio sp. TH_r3]